MQSDINEHTLCCHSESEHFSIASLGNNIHNLRGRKLLILNKTATGEVQQSQFFKNMIYLFTYLELLMSHIHFNLFIPRNPLCL